MSQTSSSSDALAAAMDAVSLPLREVKRLYIRSALKACGGSRLRAAARLGISVRTLQRHLAADDSLLTPEPAQ